MDDVRIEYRGILGDLAVGDTVVVDSCEAGVLRLRRAPAVAVAPAAPVQQDNDVEGDTDA